MWSARTNSTIHGSTITNDTNQEEDQQRTKLVNTGWKEKERNWQQLAWWWWYDYETRKKNKKNDDER